MGLVSFNGCLWVPTPFDSGTGFITATMVLTNKCAWVLQAMDAFTLHKIGIATGTVTTGDNNVDVRVETIDDTTGFPSGTLFSANSNGAINIADSDDNAEKVATLTADASIAAGQLFAIVVVPAAAGANFLVNLALARVQNTTGHPYSLTNAAGTYSKSTTSAPNVRLENASGTTIPIPGAHFHTTSTTSVNATTGNPDIVGNRIKLPFAVQCRGIWWHGAENVATNNYVAAIYDTDDATVLTSTTVDANISGGTGSLMHSIMFATPVILKANSWYTASLRATTAGNTTLRLLEVASAAEMDALPFGQNIAWRQSDAASPTGTGDWTTTATRRGCLGLIVDSIGTDANPIDGGLIF